MDLRVLDTEALRSYLGADGPWATEAGERIARRLKDMGITHEQAGVALGVTGQTIRAITQGRIVPRPYLQASIAYLLGREIEEIWPLIRRSRIAEIAAAA